MEWQTKCPAQAKEPAVGGPYSRVPYSAKFLRRIIFADASCTAEIKLAKCFLNFAHHFMIRDASLQTDALESSTIASANGEVRRVLQL